VNNVQGAQLLLRQPIVLRTSYDALINHQLDDNIGLLCHVHSNTNKMVTSSRKQYI